MRVIAGSARGRRLKGPRDRSGVTRPTSDLLRGAVFSSLDAQGVDFTRVLDLYAGSGALGIEALSRGAEWCDFVERDHAACDVIKDNLHATGFTDKARVYCSPVARVLDRLDGPYTLVLADPPYADAEALSVLERIARSALLAEDAVLVLEHSSRDEPQGDLGPLSLFNVRRHGDSAVSMYRRGAARNSRAQGGE